MRRRLQGTRTLVVLGLVGIVMAAAVTISVQHFRREQQAAARLEQVRSLVPIGASAEEAAATLRASGFVVGELHKPVADGEYCLMFVPIRSSRSTLESIEYAITGGGGLFGSRAYVVIRTDLDGWVTSIE